MSVYLVKVGSLGDAHLMGKGVTVCDTLEDALDCAAVILSGRDGRPRKLILERVDPPPEAVTEGYKVSASA